MRSYLDEATAADWSNAELDTLINSYYHAVRTAVGTVYEDYYMTTALVNTTASQEEYTVSGDSLPSNVWKIRRVEINYDVTVSTNAPIRALPIQNIDEVRRDLAFTNRSLGLGVYSNVRYYTFGFGSNFKIGFIPIPDKTGTNAIKLWYIKTASDLSSDSDTLDIPYADKYWMLIAWGATAEALRFGQQAKSDARDFEAKYAGGVIKMQEELEDRIAEESKFVSDMSTDVLVF